MRKFKVAVFLKTKKAGGWKRILEKYNWRRSPIEWNPELMCTRIYMNQ